MFTGGFGPQFDASNNPIAGTTLVLSSLDRYRRTILVQQNGLTAAQQALLWRGVPSTTASAYSAAAHRSSASIREIRTRQFRRPTLASTGRMIGGCGRIFTFSYGIRYENQTNAQQQIQLCSALAFRVVAGRS